MVEREYAQLHRDSTVASLTSVPVLEGGIADVRRRPVGAGVRARPHLPAGRGRQGPHGGESAAQDAGGGRGAAALGREAPDRQKIPVGARNLPRIDVAGPVLVYFVEGLFVGFPQNLSGEVQELAEGEDVSP